MRPQREDLVDRCKLEARQRVETKHTNRSIAFLCFALSLAIGAYAPRQLKSSISWMPIAYTMEYCVIATTSKSFQITDMRRNLETNCFLLTLGTFLL